MEPKSYFKSTCANCGGHIEAPAEGAGMWIRCPHCNEKTQLTLPSSSAAPSKHISASPDAQPRNSRRVLWISLGAVLILFLVAGAFVLQRIQQMRREKMDKVPLTAHTESTVSAPKPAPQPDLWKGLKPSAVTIEKAPKSRLVYAVGTIRNDTDKQRFGVKVLLDILDAQGENLGTTTDYTQFVDAHKDWPFKALVAFPKAATAKVRSVTEE
jgi:DNA-directed RNA polymerase subunit RPC12/RpoP